MFENAKLPKMGRMKTYKQVEKERQLKLEMSEVNALDAWEKEILEEYKNPKEEDVGKGGGKGKDIVCYSCGVKGHKAPDCPNKRGKKRDADGGEKPY